MRNDLAPRPTPGRIVRITLGLAAAGALFGATAGMVALGIGLLVEGSVTRFDDLTILILPAAFGAILGFFLAPLAGWLLLRRVPLERAFLGLSMGTLVGGLVGWFLFGERDPMLLPTGCAVIGFLLAAALLRVTHRDGAIDGRARVQHPSAP